jgi:hypothetical protein
MTFSPTSDQKFIRPCWFPQPWTVEQIPSTCGLSGFEVLDANGQSLAYVYGRETKADADIAKVLTMDEAS